MPRLRVSHVTTYDYANPVTFGEHRMMLRPRDSHDLRIISTNLAIDPQPVTDSDLAIDPDPVTDSELAIEPDVALETFAAALTPAEAEGEAPHQLPTPEAEGEPLTFVVDAAGETTPLPQAEAEGEAHHQPTADAEGEANQPPAPEAEGEA